MKTVLKILFTSTFLLFAAASLAQTAPPGKHSQESKRKKTEAAGEEGIPVRNKDDAKKTKSNIKKTGSVKQVRSARPDMSKSRGARPPDIVRPSGSGIPRGVGRPAGAGKRGH